MKIKKKEFKRMRDYIGILERDNNKLGADIRSLVLSPDGHDATIIRNVVIMESDMEKSMWSGNSVSKFDGLLNQVQHPIDIDRGANANKQFKKNLPF
jgi:hypothetical protein